MLLLFAWVWLFGGLIAVDLCLFGLLTHGLDFYFVNLWGSGVVVACLCLIFDLVLAYCGCFVIDTGQLFWSLDRTSCFGGVGCL